MADNGIIIIGDQTIGYTERETYVYWDISADVQSERTCFIETPYYLLSSARAVAMNYIQYIYSTRWTTYAQQIIPLSERFVFVHYSKCYSSERQTYYYPDTRERLAFAEGLLTQTPLLMKYPKYHNWNYIPQVLNPEFMLWSFYDLAEEDITVKMIGSTGTSVTVNSGVDDVFTITKVADKQYKIKVIIDHTFDPGETVTCYITAYDVKGNHLKSGMW